MSAKKKMKKSDGINLDLASIAEYVQKSRDSIVPKLKANREESQEILNIILTSLEAEEAKGLEIEEEFIEKLNELGARLDTQSFGKAMGELKKKDPTIAKLRAERKVELKSRFNRGSVSLVWNAISSLAETDSVSWLDAANSLLAALLDPTDAAEQALAEAQAA